MTSLSAYHGDRDVLRARCALRHTYFEVVALFPIVIEDMGIDDIDSVQLVERASFPVPWPANAFRHELTQNKNAHYIIAKEGERVVGYAGLWLSLDEAHITTFAVLPDFRRRKIGERMLVSLFARAEKLGAEWLTLEVRASNLAAQRLYEKYGFRPAGIRRRYYSDNNEDAIIMWTERLKDRSVRDRLAKLRATLEVNDQ
jgi:ribosomal-protein-alanine N-acetyltransferase